MRGKKFAVVAAILASATFAKGATMGTANGYNVFILNDLTKSNVDAEGKVAVGHDATINNYSTASHLGSGDNFIVGHDLNQTGGGTQNGNVIVYHNATLSSPTITGALEVNGNVTVTGGGSVTNGVQYKSGSTVSLPNYYTKAAVTSVTQPINFANEISYLTQASTQWGSLAATGTASSAYGNLTLSAGSSAFDVFDIAASLLASSNSLSISVAAGPGGATPTVLVNIIGATSASFPSIGITLNGVDKQHVLYNFPTETSVKFNSVGVLGSVLAPYADVNFNYGNIDGTLVANNLTGTGEEHNYPFQGNLPTVGSNPPAAVPEPASLSILAPVGIFLMRRRKR